MDERVLSLAETLVNIPGSTALLLGSGLSSSAGIPTGWEIMLDLIGQITIMQQVDQIPDDLEAWYRATFGAEPTYDTLMAKLALTRHARAELLKRYFEPTEEDQAAGRKTPTAAHRAIATLVRQGAIKVILTTNFDRLMEHALQSEGVEPTVIYTAEMIEGMLPFTHTPLGHCVIMKLHGDYLDARLKNTADELASYDKRMKQLLDQILDEYGLLICGWSGMWDRALRDAISRRTSRRFSLYWATRSALVGLAADLANQQGAIELPISDANSFFQGLEEQVMALHSLRIRAQPLTAQVAGETIKRYLPHATSFIRLDELLAEETERAFAKCIESNSQVGSGEQGEIIERRLARYEAECSVLLAMFVAGGAYATAEQAEPWIRSLTRMSNPGWRYNRPWPADLALYPALWLLYGAGVSAVARENYAFLAQLLYEAQVREDTGNEKEHPVAVALHPVEMLSEDIAKKMPSQLNHFTPLSDHLQSCLREPLRALLPDDHSYERTFDRFEYLLALARTALAEQYDETPIAPGCYVWRGKPLLWEEAPNEIEREGEQWKPLAGGLFQGFSFEQLQGFAVAVQRRSSELRLRWRFPGIQI